MRSVARGPALRPAWWLARGYLAVSLLAALGRGYPGFPLPRLAGNPALGLAAVLVAMAVSVRLGQRRLPKASRLVLVGADIVLAIFAVALLGKVGSHQVTFAQVVERAPVSNGSASRMPMGRSSHNLYAYGADGHLIDPVLLYDQDGHPVDNLCPEFDSAGRRLVTRYSQDVNGAPVINAFPRRQAVAVTGDGNSVGIPKSLAPAITVPVSPPAVVIPSLATTVPSTSLPATATTVPATTVPATTAPATTVPPTPPTTVPSGH